MADDRSRAGVSYLTDEILNYVSSLHAPHDEALERAFSTPEREGLPSIHVAPSEGRLIHLLLRLVGASKVVEVGTLAGYSAIWMARALPPGGRLWSVEVSGRHARAARANLEAAGLSDRVTVLQGEALSVLPKLESHGPFDAVFLDADKGNYAAYGAWAAAHIRPGGLLIADNAFFFGRLMEAGGEAESVRRLHEESRQRFDTVCIGTGDGLLVGVRR
ncbi:MAG: O-methyltransferase [Acidobacteriota bacterium]